MSMRLSWQTQRRGFAVVLAGLVLGLAAQLFAWYRAVQYNSELAAAAVPPGASAQNEPNEAAARLARAVQLAAAGRRDAALQLYRDVEAGDNAALIRLARFNTANLYMREALALVGTEQAPRAQPLIELAKGLYRDLLRTEPDDWDLRYNLERALRLQPEPDDDGADNFALPAGAERAITTMRGYSPGLP